MTFVEVNMRIHQPEGIGYLPRLTSIPDVNRNKSLFFMNNNFTYKIKRTVSVAAISNSCLQLIVTSQSREI